MSSTTTRLLAIAAGGAAGALLRYAVAGWVETSRLAYGRPAGVSFPWGTVAVNLSGCLLIGLFAGLFHRRLLEHPDLRAFVFIGVLGAYTTFSTFALETLTLLEEGSPGLAFANGFGSPALGVLGVWLGSLLAHLGSSS
jgi:fluoride exporter